MIKEDLDFLSKSLVEISINPFERFSESKYHEKIDSIENDLKIKVNVTPKDLYIALQPIISKLQDGHTQISHESLFPNNDYYVFPYSIDSNIEIIKSKELKSNYLKSNNNFSGQNIIKIDNFSKTEIINLFDLYSSGESQKLRIKYGEFYFNQLYNLLINKDKKNVKLQFENGSKQKIKLIKASDWIQSSNKTSKEPDLYSYKISENQAVLLFKSFNNLEKFKELLSNMFKEITDKNIQNLIIDIRNNGGGNSELGDELLKYLLDKPFTQYEKTFIKYSNPSKKYFSELTDIDSGYLEEYLHKTNGVIDTIDKRNIQTNGHFNIRYNENNSYQKFDTLTSLNYEKVDSFKIINDFKSNFPKILNGKCLNVNTKNNTILDFIFCDDSEREKFNSEIPHLFGKFEIISSIDEFYIFKYSGFEISGYFIFNSKR